MPKKQITARLFAALLLFGLAGVISADFSTPSLNLSNNDMRWSSAKDVAVIPGTGNVFALWTDLNSDLEREIAVFRKSTDGGATWAPSVALNCTDFWWWDNPYYWEMWGAAMAVDPPYIHIVMSFQRDWAEGYEVYYRRSVDLGETWEPWVRLTNNSTLSVAPRVAAAGSYVHVVYEDEWPGNREILYQRIADNGAGPVDRIRRLSYSSGFSWNASLAVSANGQVVNVVYEDDTLGNSQIIYKRITNSGAGPIETRPLTFGSRNRYRPSIATSSGIDDQFVFIVYLDCVDEASSEFEILYKRLDQYGAAGGQVILSRLTFLPAFPWYPKVAFDGTTNDVYVTYSADAPLVDPAVYYKRLVDYGGGSPTTGRVSYGPGNVWNPCLAAGGGWAFIIWSDTSADTGGIPEIFFKRGN
jgi:hypothetical protein